MDTTPKQSIPFIDTVEKEAREKLTGTTLYTESIFVSDYQMIMEIVRSYSDKGNPTRFEVSFQREFGKGSTGVLKNNALDFVYQDPNNKYALVCISYMYEIDARPLLFIFFNNREEVAHLFLRESFSLKPTLYEVIQSTFGPQFLEIASNDNIETVLNSDIKTTISTDIKSFFKSRKFYKKLGFAYKRGLLLYGPPGTGKTSTIKEIGRMVKKPTLFLSKKLQLDSHLKGLIEGSCPRGCVIVIEDIDGVETYFRSELLNFLDGLTSPDSCYFIATTNYIEKIDYALTQRPSRFDKIYQIGYPALETRKELIKQYFKEDYTKFDLEKIAKKTDGFSGAFFKELFILYKLNNYTIDEAIVALRQHMALTDGNKDTNNYID